MNNNKKDMPNNQFIPAQEDYLLPLSRTPGQENLLNENTLNQQEEILNLSIASLPQDVGELLEQDEDGLKRLGWNIETSEVKYTMDGSVRTVTFRKDNLLITMTSEDPTEKLLKKSPSAYLLFHKAVSEIKENGSKIIYINTSDYMELTGVKHRTTAKNQMHNDMDLIQSIRVEINFNYYKWRGKNASKASELFKGNRGFNPLEYIKIPFFDGFEAGYKKGVAFRASDEFIKYLIDNNNYAPVPKGIYQYNLSKQPYAAILYIKLASYYQLNTNKKTQAEKHPKKDIRHANPNKISYKALLAHLGLPLKEEVENNPEKYNYDYRRALIKPVVNALQQLEKDGYLTMHYKYNDKEWTNRDLNNFDWQDIYSSYVVYTLPYSSKTELLEA